MATVTERFESQRVSRGPDASAELSFTIEGAADATAALDALESAAPVSYDFLPRGTLTVEPLGETMWLGTVRYALESSTEPQPTGGSTFSFDTGGGTQHITQSLATVGSYSTPSGIAPDYKGAIGVTKDNVAGVDIKVPLYQFQETHYLDDADVTNAYKGTLFSLTGKVNNATFKGFAAGECLFLGATGTKRNSEDWEITYRFAASPNRSNITIGGITGINKKGWEYLWVRYEDVKDETAGRIVKQPQSAYVEKVYEEGDFSALGIGV